MTSQLEKGGGTFEGIKLLLCENPLPPIRCFQRSRSTLPKPASWWTRPSSASPAIRSPTGCPTIPICWLPAHCPRPTAWRDFAWAMPFCPSTLPTTSIHKMTPIPWHGPVRQPLWPPCGTKTGSAPGLNNCAPGQKTWRRSYAPSVCALSVADVFLPRRLRPA